jgi:hypothetical protein
MAGYRLRAVPDDDPWYDAGPPPDERDYDSPGLIMPEAFRGV